MKRALFPFVFLFIFAAQLGHVFVESALPPLYQRMAEYQALVGDWQLAQKLPTDQVILSIEREERFFIVTTDLYILKVEVVYRPQKMAGPSSFSLLFYDAVKRGDDGD